MLYCIYFPSLLPTMFIIIRSAHAYFSSFSSVLSAGSCLPLRSSAFPTLCTYVRARLRTFFMFLCTARFSLPKYNWRCDAPVFPSLSTPRPPTPLPTVFWPLLVLQLLSSLSHDTDFHVFRRVPHLLEIRFTRLYGARRHANRKLTW